MYSRPYVLTIAGFDPSSGAGLTSDIKAFEAMQCYGLAVCTANTIQNDIEFTKCHWIDIEVIKNQIEILFDRFDIEYVKIGIIQDWKILNAITDVLVEKNEKIKIVFDPILKSSSQFDFQNMSYRTQFESEFDKMLDKIYLLTPNYQEIEKLYVDKTIEETIKHITSKTNVFLKGGHRKDTVGKDQLFTKNNGHFTLNPKGQNNSEKHGSGCVVSSAITAYLALGFPLLKACFKGKRYNEKVLSSNPGLLGYHKI